MNKNDLSMHPRVALKENKAGDFTAKGKTEDGIPWSVMSFWVPTTLGRDFFCQVYVGTSLEVEFFIREGLYSEDLLPVEASRLCTTLLHEELRLHRKAGQGDSSW